MEASGDGQNADWPRGGFPADWHRDIEDRLNFWESADVSCTDREAHVLT